MYGRRIHFVASSMPLSHFVATPTHTTRRRLLWVMAMSSLSSWRCSSSTAGIYGSSTARHFILVESIAWSCFAQDQCLSATLTFLVDHPNAQLGSCGAIHATSHSWTPHPFSMPAVWASGFADMFTLRHAPQTKMNFDLIAICVAARLLHDCYKCRVRHDLRY